MNNDGDNCNINMAQAVFIHQRIVSYVQTSAEIMMNCAPKLLKILTSCRFVFFE